MRGARHLATLLLVLGAFIFAVPALAIAGGGGSAGNTQYTNPVISGVATTTTHSAPSTTTTSSAPHATTTSEGTGTAGSPVQTSASAGTTPSAPTTPTVTTPTATTPTATTAGDPTSSTTSGKGKSLPHTGYDSWEAAGFGLMLLAGGVFIRRRTHRA